MAAGAAGKVGGVELVLISRGKPSLTEHLLEADTRTIVLMNVIEIAPSRAVQ